MLLSRFFRLRVTQCSRFSLHLQPRSPNPARWQDGFRRTPYRAYRVVTPRQLLMGWNTVRLWFWSPLFYYNLAGIGLLCGGFYLYHLERVPVWKPFKKMSSDRTNS